MSSTSCGVSPVMNRFVVWSTFSSAIWITMDGSFRLSTSSASSENGAWTKIEISSPKLCCELSSKVPAWIIGWSFSLVDNSFFSSQEVRDPGAAKIFTPSPPHSLSRYRASCRMTRASSHGLTSKKNAADIHSSLILARSPVRYFIAWSK